MRTIISFFAVLLCLLCLSVYCVSKPSAKAICYSFSFKDMANRRLLVECTFQGNATGSTALVLPHQWANQSELYKNVDQLSCVEAVIEDTKEPHIKVIHHKKGEFLTIRYTIQLLSENLCHKNYYRPIGDHSYFYAAGYGMFVIPTQQEGVMAIKLQWTDLPKDWIVANSFGQGLALQEITGSPNDLRSGAFLAGDFQMIERTLGSNPVYIAMRGKWPFSLEEFTALVEQILSSQRDFWNDHAFPYYLVSVIPIDAIDSIGGTALKNSFTLFLGENPFSKEDYLKRLSHLISHEHFHIWNGDKIRSLEPERSMYWFSEGFTEYYAVKLNYKSGIISQQEYVAHVNEILFDYFSSPAHNASNETITNNFWTTPAIRKLPYDRGFAVALYLDTKIQSYHKGLSLDHLMYDLLETTKQKDIGFSLDDLFLLIAKYIDLQDLPSVKRFVIEGDSVPVLDGAMGEYCHLEWTDSIGFHLQRSLAEGIVIGVQNDSFPFQAGLVNGLKILAFNKTGATVTITVLEEETSLEKKVSYEAKRVPRYVM